MYNIVFTTSAEKELQQLPEVDINRIIQRIENLANVPKPTGVRKIKGKQGLWRLRSGNYRIIYSIFQNQLTIEIIRIRHRKDVYREFK